MADSTARTAAASAAAASTAVLSDPAAKDGVDKIEDAANGRHERPSVIAESIGGGSGVAPRGLANGHGAVADTSEEDSPERITRPSEVVVEVAPEVITEVRPDKPDRYSEVIVEVAPEVITEVRPDKPDRPSEVIVEVAPEVIVEVAPEATRTGRSSRWPPRSSSRWRRT